MPFTPFHIVAGTSIKSVFPKYFSFSTFALTNVLIDCEVLFYYFTTGILEHKFFHTIFGVTIVAIVCATLGKPICEFGLRIWNKTFCMEKIKWFKTEIKMFPFSNKNIFLRIVSVENLHFVCLGLFIIGILIYFLKKIFFK